MRFMKSIAYSAVITLAMVAVVNCIEKKRKAAASLKEAEAEAAPALPEEGTPA